VAVITAMARRIVGPLAVSDPLSANAHLTKVVVVGLRLPEWRLDRSPGLWRSRRGRPVEGRMSAAVAESSTANSGRASGSYFHTAMQILPTAAQGRCSRSTFCRRVR
jgi:hypothetical protein